MRFSYLFLSPFFCLGLVAQSPLGTVTGLATDPSGAPVPDATVTLSGADTGLKREARTNSTGLYLFPNVAPGQYTLAAEARGFQRISVAAFPLDAYKTVRHDLRFALETATAEVTVTAEASTAIQVDAPNVTGGLTTRQIIDLPTNLRSISSNAGDSGLIFSIMPMTVPGVVQMGNGAFWLVPGSGPNGLRVKVDGIETTFGIFGSPDSVSQPSMESVEEFSANLAGNKAEFGGLGVVTTATKSGTNNWHGSVFWILRNSALDARNAFLTSRSFLNIHDFGGSAGGPIRKNRTFLFATAEGFKGVRPYVFTPNVPTVAMRQGDFNGLGAVRNPYANNAPFADNKIPASLIAPEATRAQDLLFPQPNYGASTLTAANYRASFNGPETHRILELRMDHNLSSGHSVFARFQNKKDDYDIPGARSTLPPITVGTSKNTRWVNFWTFGDVWSVRPNLYNEFRGGVVYLESRSAADVLGQPLLDTIGIKGLPPRPGAPGVPNFSITGINTYTQTLLNPVDDAHWQLSDNVTWVKGRHTMKFGVQYIYWFVNRYQPSNAALYGNFNFQNRFTGQAYGDFLMGLPTTVTRLDPAAPQYFRWNDLSWYAQDDFKVTPRLSLSYGLRWEYNPPADARDGNIYNFDPRTGSVVIPSDGLKAVSPFYPTSLPIVTAESIGWDRTLRRKDLNNWAPRFGFSYLLSGDGKTVLRGGWGLYYGQYSVAAATGLVGGPFAVSTTSNNAFSNGQPLFTLAAPFAVPGGAGTLNLNGLSYDLLHMYSAQYNLSLEREVRQNLGVRLSYIGSKGTKLPYQRNINQPMASSVPFAQARRPWPIYNNIVFTETGANNNYQGAQVGVAKRFSKGLQFSSTYILAKQLSEVDDTNSAEIYTQIEDAYDRARDRANVYSVPRHQWLNNFLYEIPFGRSRWWGGWQLNGIFNLQSGHWLNPQFSGSDPSNTNNVGGRPDTLRMIDYPETVAAWYDRTAFGVPTGGRFGNTGRNTVQGPGYVLLNGGLAKTIAIERFGSFQLNASFQNVLNHVNLGQPNMVVNNTNGGTITSTHVWGPAGSARTGQVGLRWLF